jgi:hypothetical protein
MGRKQAMPEARIKTSFGDIRISYKDEGELKGALQGLEVQVETISQAVAELIPPPPRLPKPGYEKAYQFSPTGKVELLIFPSILVQKTILALFAYSPDSVSAKELEDVIGIDKIETKVLGQTNNKKYFRKTDNAYGLTTDGLDFFMEKIKPSVYTEPEVEEE